jgi:DNA-binding MarR family transcriptional regulator
MTSSKRLIADILRAARRIAAARDVMFSAHGLTSAQLRLLKTIRRLPVPFTMSALARKMGVARQSVQPSIHKLEAAGLISLGESPRNRKAALVVLTPLGRTTLEQLLRLEQRWLADLTHGCDDRLLAQTAWVVRMIRERLSDGTRSRIGNK